MQKRFFNFRGHHLILLLAVVTFLGACQTVPKNYREVQTDRVEQAKKPSYIGPEFL